MQQEQGQGRERSIGSQRKAWKEIIAENWYCSVKWDNSAWVSRKADAWLRTGDNERHFPKGAVSEEEACQAPEEKGPEQRNNEERMRKMEGPLTIQFQDFGLNFSTINNKDYSKFYIIASEKNGLQRHKTHSSKTEKSMKTNSSWVMDLDIRQKIVKTLESNRRKRMSLC